MLERFLMCESKGSRGFPAWVVERWTVVYELWNAFPRFSKTMFCLSTKLYGACCVETDAACSCTTVWTAGRHRAILPSENVTDLFTSSKGMFRCLFSNKPFLPLGLICTLFLMITFLHWIQVSNRTFCFQYSLAVFYYHYV